LITLWEFTIENTREAIQLYFEPLREIKVALWNLSNSTVQAALDTVPEKSLSAARFLVYLTCVVLAVMIVIGGYTVTWALDGGTGTTNCDGKICKP